MLNIDKNQVASDIGEYLLFDEKTSDFSIITSFDIPIDNNNQDLEISSLEEYEQTVPAHSIILEARSEYFRRLLLSGMKEAHSKIIRKPNIDYTTMCNIVRFLYTGCIHIRENGEVEHVTDFDETQSGDDDSYTKNEIHQLIRILKAAHEMQLTSLVDFIEDHLVNIADQQFLGDWESVFSVSLDLNLKKLRNSIIAQNTEVKNVMLSEKVLNLSERDIQSILESDELALEEIDLFNAVIRYINAHAKSIETDENESQELMSRFIPFIRFGTMSIEDIYNIVRPTQLVPDTVLMEAIRPHVLPSSVTSEYMFRRRKPQYPDIDCPCLPSEQIHYVLHTIYKEHGFLLDGTHPILDENFVLRRSNSLLHIAQGNHRSFLMTIMGSQGYSTYQMAVFVKKQAGQGFGDDNISSPHSLSRNRLTRNDENVDISLIVFQDSEITNERLNMNVRYSSNAKVLSFGSCLQIRNPNNVTVDNTFNFTAQRIMKFSMKNDQNTIW